MDSGDGSIIYLFLTFIGGLIGGIIGSLVTVLWFSTKAKIWIRDKRIKKAVFGFLEIQDYANLIRDSFLSINQHKDDIQGTLKKAVGKDKEEVLKLFNDSYSTLERTMNVYLARKKELEEKIFSNTDI